MRMILAAFAMFGLTCPGACETAFQINSGGVKLHKAQPLMRSDDWQAVGRLNVGTGQCTGTLIAPDLVLTAAHCFFDSRTQAPVDSEDVEFLAGWQGARAIARRGVRQVVLHPDYNIDAEPGAEKAKSDLALIRLDHPIRELSVAPFETSTAAIESAIVQMVSYEAAQNGRPMVQSGCTALATDPGILVTSCTANFGASGAPVFITEDGRLRVLAVVSSKAEWRGQQVSLSAGLQSSLSALLDAIERNDGVFRRGPAQGHADQHADGLKFLKP